MNEPTNNRKQQKTALTPLIALFPYEMKQPLNEYSDGTMVFRIREDKIPKCEILRIKTPKGDCYIRMSEVENAPIFEQVFKIQDKPMKLKQILCHTISKEDQERLKYDSYALEDKDFLNRICNIKRNYVKGNLST